MFNQDKKDYALKWAQFNSSFKPLSDLKVFSAFQYTKPSLIDSYPYAGIMNTYMGGGYMFKMNNIRSNIQALNASIKKLMDSNWIDRQTRAIFIEFTVYNPNIKLFTNCIILFEVLSTGNLIKSSIFDSVNLYDINEAYLVSFKLIMSIIYVLFIFAFTIKQIKQIFEQKFGYFKQFYNYIDICIISFSWTAISMYLYRLNASNEIFAKIRLHKNENMEQMFINLQYICYCNDLLTLFMGLCVTFGTLRFIKLLRFNKKIIVFIQAFRNSVKDLVASGVCFMLIWMAFVQAIYLIFSEKSSQFATLLTTMETCFELILGKFDVRPMISSNAVLGPTFYVFYNVLIVFMLLNIIFSILTDHYNEARLTNDLDREDPDLYDYIKKSFCSLFEKKESDVRESNPVYFDTLSSLSIKVDLLIERVDRILTKKHSQLSNKF